MAEEAARPRAINPPHNTWLVPAWVPDVASIANLRKQVAEVQTLYNVTSDKLPQ